MKWPFQGNPSGFRKGDMLSRISAHDVITMRHMMKKTGKDADVLISEWLRDYETQEWIANPTAEQETE